MPEEQLRHRLTSVEINALPLRCYDGEVKLVRAMPQWEAALPDLVSARIVGFDTETRPTFRKGKLNAPALIQLASANIVYLVQLGNLPFGKHVADLLANPDIIKVGVGIKEDMQALGKIYPFEPAGLVDLGQVARDNGMPSHGLRTLAASLFGWRISKGSQCSNWSARTLSPRQVAYAATDAWIGRMIYLRLKDLGMVEQAS